MKVVNTFERGGSHLGLVGIRRRLLTFNKSALPCHTQGIHTARRKKSGQELPRSSLPAPACHASKA